MLAFYDADRIDQRDPARVEWLVRQTERFIQPYHRSETRGVERIPPGAALYVGNHNAGLWTPDSYLFGAAVHRAHGLDAVPYGLAHQFVLRVPAINQILVPLGAVRATHENAMRLFEAGRKVLVYPGGDLDAMRPFRHRHRIVFGGRRGYIRLALRAGVPILPVVTAGAHSTFVIVDDLRWFARLIRADQWMRIKVWPLTFSVPWGFTLGPGLAYLPFPTRILQEVLPPIAFERTGEEASRDDAYVAACAHRVESSMQATMDRLSAERAADGALT